MLYPNREDKMLGNESQLTGGSINYQEIKARADKLLRENSIVNIYQFPVPIAKIANSLGYHIKMFNPDPDQGVVSGMISSQDKRILINANDSYERQRFTIAHEIGHHILHFQYKNSDEIYIDFRKPGNVNNPIKELQADEFAGCLLMPEEFFREAWNITKGHFKDMSLIFSISKAAIGMRAFNLNME